MKKRRELSEGLLAAVFNADPKKVTEFFMQPDKNKGMALAKTCYREGYHSKKLNKFVCFRHWKNVSAIQAAALCLDKFLVIQLLGYIVRDDKLRLEAKKQLEEIRSRIAKESKQQQEYVSSAAGDKKEVHEKTQDFSKGERKEDHEKAQVSAKGDEKEAYEKTQNDSADLAEYAAPIKALLKAYSDYLTQFPLLSAQGKSSKIDKLWDAIGSCFKRLPRYVLQEIFKYKRWDDDSYFSHEPFRGELHCWHKALDLDELGDGSLVALYKAAPDWWSETVVVGKAAEGGRAAQMDSAAIRYLYELRLVDLGNIIEALETPEAAIALVTEGKGMALKHR